jgi:hypothetical protein
MPSTACAWSLAAIYALSAASAAAEEPAAFRCLADAYPDWVSGFRQAGAGGHPAVQMRDGSAIVWDDGNGKKTPAERIDNPDLEDMFALSYPAGAAAQVPAPDEDPGRARVTALFDGLYGQSEAEAQAALDAVAWLPHLGNKQLRFNRRHGAAAALRRVSADLEKLPARFRPYFVATAGTFNRRAIAGTTRPSAHSWGIAIDLNVAFADYWRWNLRPDGALPYKNRIPIEIVRVFERHGFIWGGRWHHYDTMHFEYRPELLHVGCARAPQQEVPR